MISLSEKVIICTAIVIVLCVIGLSLYEGYRQEGLKILNSPYSGDFVTVAPTPQEQVEGSPQYGCPGCPGNFMDFSKDMCNRFGSNYTVSDGCNTLKCSELGGLK